MTREIIRDPVYRQVTSALTEIIRSEFSVGDRFLTEREVSGRFGISRTTANKALSNLVADGLLEFRTGVGTFVRPTRPNVDLRRLLSFTEKACAAGLEPGTQVRRLRTVTLKRVTLFPPAELAAILEIDDRDGVHEIERVRTINGKLVIYERRALRVDHAPDLTEADLTGSLYSVLHDRFGCRLAGVVQRIRARSLSAGEAETLGTTKDTAALELSTVGYLTDGSPIWYEETLYRGDAYEFLNQVSDGSDESRAGIGPRESEPPAERPWYRWT